MATDMERFDICQGSGMIHTLKTVSMDGVGYKAVVSRKVEVVNEQCPKCDGKGMVKK